MAELLLGPILRYVDDRSATVWVETDRPCTVEILGSTARTFRVAGHHYALVVIRDLTPATSTAYQVKLDDVTAWSPTAEGLPESRINTLPRQVDNAGSTLSSEPQPTFRLLFGSCRYGPNEDARQAAKLGPDALEAQARLLAADPRRPRPDAMLLLGDQVYADETPPQVRRLMWRKRDPRRPPHHEVADFGDYTLLYRHTWGQGTLRWLLSTVPSMMIFDDHDVRDDWNTSYSWRRSMARTDWWQARLVGGLVSYWIYQHLGNLSPDQLDVDPVFQRVLREGRDGDAWEVLAEFARRADTETDGVKGARWSYARDLGPARLVVIDSRGGRILDSAPRAMLSESDFAWLRENCESDLAHLVLATSLPWLLPHAVHYAQAWNEAVAAGTGRAARAAEKLRQAADLEHWAAFRDSFDRLSRLIGQSAERRRGDSTSRPGPGDYSTVSVLSGDVHHSYLAEADYTADHAPVLQVTCSPMHNRTPRGVDGLLRRAWSARAARAARRLARRAKVADPPLSWSKTSGPHFGNTIGIADFHGDRAEFALHRIDDERGNWSTLCRDVLR